MTKNEIIERALREANILPRSITDNHYGNETEMTKAEIILRSLDDMGLLSLSAENPEYAEKVRRIQLVVGGLQHRLPDGDITVCGAFSFLDVGCCDICHTDPLQGMKLIGLPGSGWAWVCCAVDAASCPEKIVIIHEREEDPPGGKKQACKYRSGGRRGD